MAKHKKSIFKRILKWTIRILGVYIIWFLVGVLLVETGVLERFPLGFGGHITNRQGKRDFSGVNVDGPHMEYQGSMAVVRFIEQVDTIFMARKDSFSIAGFSDLQWKCQPVSAPGFQFKVQSSLPSIECKYELPDKIFVLSDLEGNFSALRNLLLRNGVINENYAWTFGNGHVVILGDVFDRGLEVTQCLWLLYHLETQANIAGGKLHLVMGNHEVMNLNGDYRYVRNQYLENAKQYNWDYSNWFSDSTVLGRWLAQKPMLLQLGPFLFAHGGVNADVTAFKVDIDSLNKIFTRHLKQSDLAQTSKDTLTRWCFNDKYSPFWYRGYIEGNAEASALDAVLTYFSAKNMIVGHTVVDRVGTFYEGKIIAVDTRHSKGIQEGLLWVNGEWQRVDAAGKKYPLEPL